MNIQEHSPKSVDLVILDDDKFFADTIVSYLMKGMQVDVYYNPYELFDNISKYPKTTKFAIDNNYKDIEISGVDVAKQLHKLGFTNLYILSGDDPESIDCQGIATAIQKNMETGDIEKFLVKPKK